MAIAIELINKREFYFKKNQINKFLKLFDKKYIPKTLIIYERRIDLFKNLSPIGTSLLPILFGRTEGTYHSYTDTICIFVFSENDDRDDKQSFQLYSLHALCHELRHRFHFKENSMLDDEEEEDDADLFATSFMAKHSHAIKSIMNWDAEWEVEEY